MTEERTERHDSLQHYNRFIAIPKTTNKEIRTKFEIPITINMVKKIKVISSLQVNSVIINIGPGVK